ncbi:hypothetical protein Staley_20 [Bacillus phage Staley]|uniref:Uncharacterized protein n=1 Tax=Bacillus phage Staley TaxID=1406792 RepID=U5Q1B1_9CAUD|nr:hypothetical protein Staley_20 [Bacillus phage Staley]AGY48703.1 hypothetical protein Staley_20 [Bacillus phage Staley]
MIEKVSDVMYAAVHKELKKFFVGSGTRVAFAKKGHLKSSMTYRKANHNDYEFYAITSDGVMMQVEA